MQVPAMPLRMAQKGRGTPCPLPWMQAVEMGLAGEDARGKWRKIPLTQGQFATIDAADYEWLMRWNWSALRDSHNAVKSFRAIRDQRLTKGRDGRRTAVMSRVIMNEPPGLLVDHENHDTLNNRRFNLRVATRAQNGYNRRKSASAKGSRFKGVTWHAPSNKWKVRITINKKQINLGYRVIEEDAGELYRAAALALHGEFACTESIHQIQRKEQWP